MTKNQGSENQGAGQEGSAEAAGAARLSDGGPAFPVLVQYDTYEKKMVGAQVGASTGWYEGMTLRDWFAGKALQGLLAGGINVHHELHNARTAYIYADAMLAARAEVAP